MARVVWKKNPAYQKRERDYDRQPEPEPQSQEASPLSEDHPLEDERFSDDYLASLRNLDPRLKTRSDLITRARELEALRTLGADTEYDWLTRKEDGQDWPWKRRILSELGTLEDPAEMRAVARELCLIQPTREDALALVNRFLKGESRSDRPARTAQSRREPEVIAAEYVRSELGDEETGVEADVAQPSPSEAPPDPAPEAEPTTAGADSAPIEPNNPEDRVETNPPQVEGAGDVSGEKDSPPDAPFAYLAPVASQGSEVLSNPQEAQLAREISDAMNRAIVDFGMRHDLSPQQVRRALMHSALEILRNCID